MAANTSKEISSPVTGTREVPPRRRERRVFPYLALIPAALFVAGLMLLPIGATIYHSFTNWDGLTSTFIGMRNFSLILHNPIVSQIFLNSVERREQPQARVVLIFRHHPTRTGQGPYKEVSAVIHE